MPRTAFLSGAVRAVGVRMSLVVAVVAVIVLAWPMGVSMSS